MNRNVVVLLTATIVPNTNLFLKRNNIKTRELDYINSVSKYLKYTDVKIIFVENSGYDLSKIDLFKNDRIEIIQTNATLNEASLGKGYGEMYLLKAAVEKSKFINKDTFIIKITGRLIVKNIYAIIEKIDCYKDIELFVDLKGNLSYADSRLFIFKKIFFTDYLFNEIKILDDTRGVHFEEVLSYSTFKAIIDGIKWGLIPYDPIFLGYSGTDNSNYRTNFWIEIKKYFKRLILIKFLK